MTATEIRTRLMEMDARSEEQIHIGAWDDGAGRTGQGFCVEDPDGHDEKGIGIIVTDDDDVLVHDWHGSGVYAGIGEAERILDSLDVLDGKGGGTPLTDAGTVDHAAVDMASRRSTPADDVYPHTVRAAEDEELLDQWGQA